MTDIATERYMRGRRLTRWPVLSRPFLYRCPCCRTFVFQALLPEEEWRWSGTPEEPQMYLLDREVLEVSGKVHECEAGPCGWGAGRGELANDGMYRKRARGRGSK